MSRRSSREVTYGVRASGPWHVWAWRSAPWGGAETLPRGDETGSQHVPYSCVTGHVTSWLLWWDVLSDALGDRETASRLAGLMEADMSAYLRERGRVAFTANMVRAWAALHLYKKESLVCV